jgi:hypothetical protein
MKTSVVIRENNQAKADFLSSGLPDFYTQL